MTMVSGSLNLVLTLNECVRIATHAAKNLDYMNSLYHADNSIKDYFVKTRRMADELPHLLRRANELKQILEEYNAIAMR